MCEKEADAWEVSREDEGAVWEREGYSERWEEWKGRLLVLRRRIWWFCRNPVPRKGGGWKMKFCSIVDVVEEG